MTEDELDAIEGRLKAATPGPWRWDDDDASNLGLRAADGALVVCGVWHNDGTADCEADRPEDAEFIAHAPTDIAALLAEVRRIKQWEPLKPHCQACGEELFGDYWQPGPACDGIRHAGPIQGVM